MFKQFYLICIIQNMYNILNMYFTINTRIIKIHNHSDEYIRIVENKKK